MRRFLTLSVAVALSFLLLFSASARADTKIAFTITRKGDDIGTQVMKFHKDGDAIKVDITTRIAVKVLMITAYKFTFDGTETWKGGKLVALDTHTNDNGEKHAVTVAQKEGKLTLTADGKSREIPADTVTASWWNNELTKRNELLDVLTGKMQPVTVKKLDDDMVKVTGSDVLAHHFEVSGGLQRNVWYKGGMLVRQSVIKKGDLIEFVQK